MPNPPSTNSFKSIDTHPIPTTNHYNNKLLFTSIIITRPPPQMEPTNSSQQLAATRPAGAEDQIIILKPQQQPANLQPQQRADLDSLPFLDYRPQAAEEVVQLDTDEDKTGVIPVAHIVKRTRDVYGKTPIDMKNIDINWAKWGVSMSRHNRPSPYMFPAFEKQVADVRRYEHTQYDNKRNTVDRTNSDAFTGPTTDPGAGGSSLTNLDLGMDSDLRTDGGMD